MKTKNINISSIIWKNAKKRIKVIQMNFIIIKHANRIYI